MQIARFVPSKVNKKNPDALHLPSHALIEARVSEKEAKHHEIGKSRFVTSAAGRATVTLLVIV
jgi:hypothetical protein